ncbi:MAG TPA: Plug domain-containing protein [Fibrobacteria bacterium]|nr:Plug domain-containing protein [Fibrobacteria bacterium]
MNARLLSSLFLVACAGFAQDSIFAVPDSAASSDTTHVEFRPPVDSAIARTRDLAGSDSMGAPPLAPIDSAIQAGGADSIELEPADSVRETESGSVTRTVTVKGQARHKRKEISTNTIRREDAKKVVATMQDPLRALSTLPGVSTASDLSVRPVVRGGDLTETGVQLDGVPLLMPYHFGSVFSVFHQEAMEDFQLYSGVAPASAEGMLSGMVVARSRSAPVDTFFGGVDVSMLRGSAWLGVPLVEDRVGLWLSAQSLWYDWTLKRFMDLGVLLGAADKDDVEEYKSMVTLPTSWDLQGGISAKLGRDWMLDVGGFVAGDKFRVLEPTTICLEGGKEAYCSYSGGYYYDSLGRWVAAPPDRQEHKTIYDTSAIVDLTNWMARTRLSWNPDRDLTVEAVGAWQSVDWHAQFPGHRELDCDRNGKNCTVRRDSDSSLFDWTRSLKNLGLSVRKRWSQEHETHAGLGVGQEAQSARTDLLRPVAQLIMGTTGNPMEFLGVFNEEEIRFSGSNNRLFLDIESFADVEFDYDTSVKSLEPTGWFEHRWDPDSRTRVRAGLRIASDAQGGIDIPNPRLQVQRQITDKDLFGVGIALHTQSEMPFEWNFAANKPLKSEKAWLGIVEWEHAFAPGWRSTVSGWGKLYRDLASSRMAQVGKYDSAAYRAMLLSWVWNNFLSLGIPDSVMQGRYGFQYDPNLSQEENTRRSDSVSRLNDDEKTAYVPEDVRAFTAEVSQDRVLRYESTGEGWAAGLEFSLRYQPTPAWTGWASAEWSISRRKDRPDGIWYPFGLERPWKLSWVNAFRIDKKWEISLRYAAQAGNPYTPSSLWGQMFMDGDESDSVLWIGKRNSARLAPYQRLDLRVARESRMFGFPATFYYEMWNAFNDPNFILRDSESGQFRWIQLNVPFPTVFLGMEVRF